jgi:hypothetical protein
MARVGVFTMHVSMAGVVVAGVVILRVVVACVAVRSAVGVVVPSMVVPGAVVAAMPCCIRVPRAVVTAPIMLMPCVIAPGIRPRGTSRR